MKPRLKPSSSCAPKSELTLERSVGRVSASYAVRMSHVDDVRRLLIRELDGFRREIALFPDETSLWQNLPGVTNSAGNLALHVAGNLQYFVGTCVGGGSYVRDRPAEFASRTLSRAEVDEVL